MEDQARDDLHAAPTPAAGSLWGGEPRPRNGRSGSDIAMASAKVAAIVEAAERAAEDLRAKTEDRARSRIAEADRAADLRVQAAEQEANEIVEGARQESAAMQAEAHEAVRHIHEEAARAREEAERLRAATAQATHEEATRMRADAETYADDVRRKAKTDARDIIAEAHGAARGVLHDGQVLSGHLQELSHSLHKNAERLLNDVKLAHGRLTADLDQALPDGAPGSPPDGPHAETAVDEPSGRSDFGIPEFVHRRR